MKISTNNITVTVICAIVAFIFLAAYLWKTNNNSTEEYVIDPEVQAELKTNFINYVMHQITVNWPEASQIEPQFMQFSDDEFLIELENDYRHVLIYYSFIEHKVRICYYWSYKGKDKKKIKTFHFRHKLLDAEKLQNFVKKPDDEVMELIMKKVAHNIIDEHITPDNEQDTEENIEDTAE